MTTAASDALARAFIADEPAVGVSLRFPDPLAGEGIWRSTWVGPGRPIEH